MGNPILKNDRIGILVGQRLEKEFRHADRITIREFSGSPLHLITELQGFDQVVLLDAIASNQVDAGSVLIFTADELLKLSKTYYLHGMNLSEAFALSRKLGVALPHRMILIGIEVEDVAEFGETLSQELYEKLPQIYIDVLGAIRDFMSYA